MAVGIGVERDGRVMGPMNNPILVRSSVALILTPCT